VSVGTPCDGKSLDADSGVGRLAAVLIGRPSIVIVDREILAVGTRKTPCRIIPARPL
jgi:hypothetical protein